MISALQMLRNWVPAPMKRRLKGVFGIPQTRLHPDWKILEPIGPVYAPHTILDVGAHHGWFFHCWKDWCPEAEIHAFEPYPESCSRAIELYGKDNSITVNQIGVSDQVEERQFFVLGGSKVSNSFLPPNRQKWDEIEYITGNVTTAKATTTTLDRYCREHGLTSIYLMKIDVQGYELKVLHGAEGILPTVSYVFVESGIRPLYVGAARFTEVFDYLSEHGFHLMAMQAWHRGNRTLMETDMLFRRDDLMQAIDTSIERVYERIG